MELEYLEEVLEKSVELHGEQPLSNNWLLNIIRVAIRKAERDEEITWLSSEDIF